MGHSHRMIGRRAARIDYSSDAVGTLRPDSIMDRGRGLPQLAFQVMRCPGQAVRCRRQTMPKADDAKADDAEARRCEAEAARHERGIHVSCIVRR